jgi:hypothetical protein
MQKKWDALEASIADEQSAAFLDYCKTVVDSKEAGELSIQEASYRICGALSVISAETQARFEEGLDLACDLELPVGQRKVENQDEEASWDRLKSYLFKN